MNKAKLVLSGVALFAVVGGAFAFKAAKFGATNRVYTSYTTRTVQGGPLVTRCSTINFSTTTNPLAPISTVYSSTIAAPEAGGILCSGPVLVTNVTTAPAGE